MIVKVNDEDVELNDGSSLADLASIKQFPDKGVAVAVNNEMITRSDWDLTRLKNGDDVIVIRAVCGG